MALNEADAKKFDQLVPPDMWNLLDIDLRSYSNAHLKRILERLADEDPDQTLAQQLYTDQLMQSDVASHDRWLTAVCATLDSRRRTCIGFSPKISLMIEAMGPWTDGWMQFGKEADAVQIKAWCDKYPEWTFWITVHDPNTSYIEPGDRLVHAILHGKFAEADALFSVIRSFETLPNHESLPAWLVIKILNHLSSASKTDDRSYPHLIGGLIRELNSAAFYHERNKSLWYAFRLNTFVRDDPKFYVFAKYMKQAMEYYAREGIANDYVTGCIDAFDALASHYPLSVHLLVIDRLEMLDAEIKNFGPLDKASATIRVAHKEFSRGYGLIEDQEKRLRNSWPSHVRKVFNLLTASSLSLATIKGDVIEAWKSKENLVVNQNLPSEMHHDEA